MKRTKTQSHKTPVAILLLFVCIAVYITISSGYILYAIRHDVLFAWSSFAMILAGLGVLNLCLLYVAWHYRKQLSPRLSVFILDWGSVAIWYWIFAPLYQYLTVTFNSVQLRIDAFAFLWEVSFFGVFGFLLGQLFFRPINHYALTGHASEPAALYVRMSRFPFQAASRAVIFAMIGFALGAWQIQHFADLPTLEAYKDVANGVVLSLFLAIFHYLAFDSYLGPIRTKLRKQYRLKVQPQRFRRKLYFSIVFVLLGSLSLVSLIFMQSYQTAIKKTLTTQTAARLDQVILMGGELNTGLELGSHGFAWVQDKKAPLSINVSETVKHDFLFSTEGELWDNTNEEKLIVYRPYGPDQKFIAVVILSDYYGYLGHSAVPLLAGFGVLVFVCLAAAIVLSRIVTKTVGRLTDSVHQAQQADVYVSPSIHSSDEFEELSDAFSMFVSRIRGHTNDIHREQAKLKASIGGLRLGFILTDKSNHVTLANEAAVKTLRLEGAVADLEGKRLSDIPIDTEGPFSLLRIAERARKYEKYVTKEIDTQGCILRLMVSPILFEQEYIGVAIILEDITEVKLNERSRDEFFSIASHELRTPLTAIRGNAAMIQNYYGEQLKDESLSEMVGDIHDSSARLIEIVSDFLDVSRLEQGKIQYTLESFALDKVIEKVAYEMSASGQQKGVHLALDQMRLHTLDDVYADKSRVQQILYNLLGNAVKFTGKGGTITISVEQQPQKVKVSITDTGEGIDNEAQKLLFRKFQQVGKNAYTRNSTRGTGLGLYICRLLAEQMHGAMRLEWSEKGKGSTFSFTLPLAPKK